ncbi:tRNA (guanosine(37)-N1)-methyltransferase TrmD [Syntrophomonas palmitatica]|uniref:tRNA (guanosine(37)-N1)-methyltransferase TrmD n=1 Tax=Syntrophomonas palmitatica TaxID=402877 RepID=UPI0006D2919C|nr:tRNA (guanosine(37)-N1)-methyltransferase TrmD [Syntrophomonas palmitatica]
MRIDILTLFPGMFTSPFSESIIKRAREKGLVELNTIDIRDYAPKPHRQVDDYPFGGGVGMVMKPDVIGRALAAARGPQTRVVYMSPQGRVLNHAKAKELSGCDHLLILCGHYEGIDDRVLAMVDEEISIGDYVLTGGELAAMVLVDAAVRFLPGVLGDIESAYDESFARGLLEYPHYTRPRECDGMEVPEILLSGHHENIRIWRKKQSLLNTLLKRPELLLQHDFDDEEKRLLMEILFQRE